MSENATAIQTSDTELLSRTWKRPGGLYGFLVETNHKAIGLRFVITSFVFFLLAGVLALLMRMQLAVPLANVLNAEVYNQIFTMHGTTMMFLFIVPMLEGIGIYLVPLMIGSREVAFVRLNVFSYWIYLFAGILLFFGFAVGQAADAGWFTYVPLANNLFSPNSGVDYWALSVSMIEISALAQAVTLLTTILKSRAPGMSLNRMPVMVWTYLVMSALVMIAMPALLTASFMLELDRSIGTRFFDAAGGGDPVLWQHLFWWFGHPDVYIMFLPAYGMVAAIVATFARRELVGYIWVVLAVVSIGFINLAVWAHHMFAVGFPWLVLGFFASMSVLVAIPSGVQIFAWLATVWSSRRLWMATPLLFTIGFVIIFVLGGITGVTVAAVPFNLQVHDTYYIVAHFHYVLIGGMVFPMIAGFYYWFPKVTGRLMSESLGKWNFWVAFIGFNLAFFPMHLAGFWGMPRRVFTYQPALGLDIPNLLSTIGAFVFATSFVLLIINLIWGARRGAPAGDNPWGAATLEWATSSPPAPYGFRTVPSVRSRNPLWDQAEYVTGPEQVKPETEREQRLLVDLRDDRREMLITNAVTAVPEARHAIGRLSIWPFLTALASAIAFAGAIAELWSLLIGLAAVTVTVALWHWPRRHPEPVPVVPLLRAEEAAAGGVDSPAGDRTDARVVGIHELTDVPEGSKDFFYWGMYFFIAIESVMVGALIMSYYYLTAFEAEWPPGNTEPADLGLPIAYTIVLVLSSVAMWLGERAIEKNRKRQLAIWLTTGIVLGLGYLGMKVYEYAFLTDYQWHEHAYASIVWAISGFHALHVLSVVIKGIFVAVLAWQGHWSAERKRGVSISGLYWHFVVIIWIPLFFTLYVAPRLL